MANMGRGVRVGYMPLAPFERNRMRPPVCHVRWDRGIVIGTGVARWKDLSMRANDLVQATVGAQPAYGSRAGINLKGAVTGDGINDFLKLAALTLNQPSSSWIAGVWVGAFAAQDTMIDGGSVATRELYRPTATHVAMYAGAGLSWDSATPQSWHSYIPLYNGASSQLYQDGVSVAAANVGAGTANGVTLFAQGDGTLCGNAAAMEVAIFDYLLGPRELAIVNDFSYRSYGL